MVVETLNTCRENLQESLLNATREPWLKDIHCTTAVCAGGPADLLRELTDVDLVVVGTSGARGFQKALLGSTAETVFRTSSKPVLTVGPHCVVPENDIPTIGTILCAVDLPPGSPDVIPYALSLAGRYNAPLLLLHVLEEPGVLLALEQACARAETFEELRKLMPHNAAYEVRTRYVVDFGNADSAILNEAHMHDAKLIVVGAHRSRVPALTSRFPGGTAYSVAATAECPVLTIPRANGLALGVTDVTESQQCRE